MSNATPSKTVISSMPERSLVCIESVAQLSGCREVQREYIAWIDLMLKREHGIGLSADSICLLLDEVTSNWSLYSGRKGKFYLAYIGKSVGGMAGIKFVSKDVCELKRLFVLPLYRRVGLGRSLVERLLAAARILGYCRVRLETLDFMLEAIHLYESLGFVRTAEFEDAEGRGYCIQEHEIYFALDL